MIKGVTIRLYEQARGNNLEGDEAGGYIFNFREFVEVDNVLYAPTTFEEYPISNDLEGTRTRYTLAIPKGDTHDWNRAGVVIDGVQYRVVSVAAGGIEENIPLSWNKKVIIESMGDEIY